MIRNPNDIQDGAKKIRMLIAGYPGIGKSTLALSSPRPLHIDCDFGIDRIEPRYRMPYIQPRSYDEILNDLKPENLKDFETLVFDTARQAYHPDGPVGYQAEPQVWSAGRQSVPQGLWLCWPRVRPADGLLLYELKKNIVVVFHATEEKDGDNTRLRIKVEGQTKNNVWEPMDLGGFVEMYGNDRTIGFSNCEKYFAKGTRGIHGVYKIPALGPGSPNDFLTKLFEEYNSKAAEEVAANAKENEAYEQVMQEGSKIIAGIKDADTANAAMPPFKALQHHLTSRQELNAQWKAKIAALGLTFVRPLPSTSPQRRHSNGCIPCYSLAAVLVAAPHPGESLRGFDHRGRPAGRVHAGPAPGAYAPDGGYAERH